mmetsp:Transcript_37854/g.97932  ORF Transcript_37854/g.97932 Transcript_37854/m.97932 type:complete len:386 (+) Transcript_37854:171-1328(+)
MALPSRCDFSSAASAAFSSAVFGGGAGGSARAFFGAAASASSASQGSGAASALTSALTSTTPWPDELAPTSSLTSFLSGSAANGSSSFTSSRSALAALISFTFSPPRPEARPPFSKFLYMSAKPAPFSCFSAAKMLSRVSCLSISSSKRLRFLSSSLKASVTNTSQSLRASFSFFSSRSSMICCSTLRLSVASMTFSMYLACRWLPVATFSAPFGTVSPTRFFCVKASARTDCDEDWRPASSLMSSMTSSYWKTEGSSACRDSAIFCACSAFSDGLAQAGKPFFCLREPSSSSPSKDSLNKPVTPPAAAALAVGLRAGRLRPAGLAPAALLGPAGLAPKPKPLKAPVLGGPARCILHYLRPATPEESCLTIRQQDHRPGRWGGRG